MYWSVPTREEKELIEKAGLESASVAVHRCESYLTVLHHKSHTTTTLPVPPDMEMKHKSRPSGCDLFCEHIKKGVAPEELEKHCRSCSVYRLNPWN